MKAEKKLQQRTCLGCQSIKNKYEMLRIVCDNADMCELDIKQNKPGRGAYICTNEDCLKTAIKKKAFNRAFRRQLKDKAYYKIKEEFTEWMKNSAH